jgi:hypothetical protein
VPLEDVLMPHPQDFMDAHALGLTAQVGGSDCGVCVDLGQNSLGWDLCASLECTLLYCSILYPCSQHHLFLHPLSFTNKLTKVMCACYSHALGLTAQVGRTGTHMSLMNSGILGVCRGQHGLWAVCDGVNVEQLLPSSLPPVLSTLRLQCTSTTLRVAAWQPSTLSAPVLHLPCTATYLTSSHCCPALHCFFTAMSTCCCS